MDGSIERHIRLEGAHNVRDLGGYSTAGGRTTKWRSMLRADGLHGLTEADIDRLLGEGLRTVIDLRGDKELDRQPNPFAEHGTVRYLNIPLFAALSPIDLVASDGSYNLTARYLDAIDQCGETFGRVLASISDAEDGIVLFHCTVGKDRTGLIAAMLLAIAGVNAKTIAADYALTAQIAGPLLTELRTEALARGRAPEIADRLLSCPPEAIDTVLNHLTERYQGIGGYADRIGIGKPQLDRLMSRLTGKAESRS